jgi:hypothetical protein
LLLGLPPDATPAAAVAALHVLTLVYHPNNSASPEVRFLRSPAKRCGGKCGAAAGPRAAWGTPQRAMPRGIAAPRGALRSGRACRALRRVRCFRGLSTALA